MYSHSLKGGSLISCSGENDFVRKTFLGEKKLGSYRRPDANSVIEEEVGKVKGTASLKLSRGYTLFRKC